MAQAYLVLYHTNIVLNHRLDPSPHPPNGAKELGNKLQISHIYKCV